MVGSFLGRERSLTIKGWSFTLIAAGTAGAGSYYAYSFIKRFKLSTLLRNVPKKALGDVSVGEYVRVEGMITTSVPSKETATVAKVTGGAAEVRDSLVSPKLTEYRVMEEVTTTTASVGKSRAPYPRPQDGFMSLTNLNYNSNDQKGKSSDKVDKTDGRIVHTKDKWSRKEEVMKEMKRMAPAILIESRDGDSSAFLHLDLSGEPLFFELDTVYDQFRDAERQVEVRSSRRTLGYREVEKVLPLYTTLLIFGEVSVKTGTTNELVIKKPATQHMFDRKTARNRPFVITTMNESELISKVEGLARIDLYIFGACTLLAAVTGGLALWSFRDLKGLREIKVDRVMLN